MPAGIGYGAKPNVNAAKKPVGYGAGVLSKINGALPPATDVKKKQVNPLLAVRG